MDGGGRVGQGVAGLGRARLRRASFWAVNSSTAGMGASWGPGQAGCLPVTEGAATGPSPVKPGQHRPARNRPGVVAGAARPGLRGLGWR